MYSKHVVENQFLLFNVIQYLNGTNSIKKIGDSFVLEGSQILQVLLSFRSIYELIYNHSTSLSVYSTYEPTDVLTRNYVLFQESMGLKFSLEKQAYRAATCGSVEVLELVKERDPCFQWTINIMDCAVAADAIEVVCWLRLQMPKCPWDSSTTRTAAEFDRLNMLTYLRNCDPPCPWGTSCSFYAAMNGHIRILEYLRDTVPPCPYDDSVSLAAACNGSLPLMKWLLEQSPPYPLHSHCFANALTNGFLDVAQYLYSRDNGQISLLGACNHAAIGGHLEALQWLRSLNPPAPWSSTVCANSVNYLPVLQWLRSQDPPCPWDASVTTNASCNGKLASLQWLRSQDPPCPWNPNICAKTANSFRFDEVVEWIRSVEPNVTIENLVIDRQLFEGDIDDMDVMR